MTGEIAPRIYRWDAERSVMVPLHARQADKLFVDGEEYRLGIIEDRSSNSHNHFFAALTEAWRNLPDELSERFFTAEHLRKYALIKAGYCDVQELVASSHAEALRISAYIRGMDEYAVVTVKEKTVQRFTAKSQSVRAMGKGEFQASKDAVLGIISAMIGVTPEQLRRNRAA